MSLQYIKSQKGRNQLLYKGYLHKKERASGDKIVWKCVDYHKYRCTGRAHTCDDQVVKYVPHLHPPHKTPVEAQKVVYGMKEMASSQESAHERVTANCDVLLGAVAKKKPRIQNNPKQTIQRLRACLNATRQGISNLQKPAAIAETVAADPPSSPSLTPPRLQECSDGSRDESFMAAPILSIETQAGSRSALTWTSQEAGRQRFRTGPIPAGEAPQKMLSQLSEAAQQWLCPWAHNKDQIVDLVILEQFLNVLPVDMQAWLRAREPGSSKEAAQLAEGYSREQEPANMTQGLVTFEDISVHFTEEEWALLGHGEKNLYWNVMHQNYDNVAWLGDGTDSKGKEEDTSWGPSTSSVVDLLGKSEEAVSQSPERDMIRENCLTRQTKNSSGKEEEEEKFVHFRKGLGDLARDPVHLDTERWCICTDCEKRGESSTQKISTEEDPGPMILSEELHVISEKKSPQNPEQSLIKEDQNHVEKQQSNHLGKEEGKSILLRGPVHQDTRLGQETQRISTERTEQDESLTLVGDQNIYSGEDSEWRVLPKESWEMSVVCPEHVCPEQGLPADPMCTSSTLSPAELNGTADSVSESHTLEKHQANSLGNEGQEEEPILSGNSLRELTKDMLYPDTQSALEAQHMCINSGHQDKPSKCIGSQKTDHGEDLNTCLKHARQFTQSSDPIIQPSCSYFGGNSDGLSAFIKCRRFGKKGQYFKERNMHIKSVLEAHQRTHLKWKRQKRLLWVDQRGYRQSRCRFLEAGKGLKEHPRQNPLIVNAQTRNAFHPRSETVSMSLGPECSSSDHKGLAPQQRCSSPPLLDKMVTESTVAQLIAVLQQVAADTAEIKSAVSSLHSTIIGIHHALGSLSGCTDEAEHRISNLEDTSQNTKAQLVQHCNDIKAIEAKLVGKAVQTNVIAGLWSSLRVKRGASPLNLSPNS